MLLFYAAAIFISAFLLFLIEPMFARMILPKLGGAPAVWNTAMVFYQAALLAGYGYAHLTTKWLGVRKQTVVHLLLMFSALLLLPIAAPANWNPPAGENPVLWLLSLIAVCAGLPFFIISAGSPLLQLWFASTKHKYSADPYFLYAASNLGSLLALVSYPVVIEPLLDLHRQSLWWSAGYAALLFAMIACAFFVWRTAYPAPAQDMSSTKADIGAIEGIKQYSWASNSSSEKRFRRLRWILLSFVPSSLMISVTTCLTTNIAAMPLLWVLPLSIYLLTFILVFARRPPLSHLLMMKLMALMVVPLTIILITHGSEPIALVIPIHLAALFLISMVCHGELARNRPPVANLTEFYLFISLGGVLGGIFNALVAPLVFSSLAEYPIILTLACCLIPWNEHPSDSRRYPYDIMIASVIGLAAWILVVFLQRSGPITTPMAAAVAFGPPLLAAFSFSRRSICFGLSVGAILLVGTMWIGPQGRIYFADRSFFGVTQVTQDPSGKYYQIMHGNTLHGRQAIDPSRNREPLAYYFATGPLGQVFLAFDSADTLKNIAVVGLGSGAMSCYSKPGQKWTYFEIDPVVVRTARDSGYFTFLENSPADNRIILGDGRISLASIPDGSFDLLILDAYNSDSMPVHLLTREALQLYLKKLTTKGILLLHISNRYLDLEPVLGNLARDARLAALAQSELFISQGEFDRGKISSRYLIMAQRKNDLGSLANDPRWATPRSDENNAIWTDNYSSILGILRWHR